MGKRKSLGVPIDSLLTPIPEKENTQELLQSERRKVIRITRDMFQASVEQDHSTVILSRARLRSIGGAFEEKVVLDRKMWKLYSWFYLGLHYEAVGNIEESKRCMKMALQLSTGGNGNDLMHILPMLHMSRRNWFDDEAIDVESTSSEQLKTRSIKSSESDLDPIITETIRSSLEKLRLAELQQALKVRGLHTSGSKDDLQARLFLSLVDDTRLRW
jgi:hypothetical protein